MTDPHNPSSDTAPVNAYPRAYRSSALATLPAWARVPRLKATATPPWEQGHQQLCQAYVSARRVLAAAGPDAVPAAGPDRAGTFTQTALFADAADAAESALYHTTPPPTDAVILIASLAYADAARDRADRARAHTGPTQVGYNPFGPPPGTVDPLRIRGPLPVALWVAHGRARRMWLDCLEYEPLAADHWGSSHLVAAQAADAALGPFVPRWFSLTLATIVATLAYPGARRQATREWRDATD